ncbi:MAG: TetR/AcrR family transcriptional regulator [Bacillota bacterium]
MAKPANISNSEIIAAARTCLQQRGLGATTLKEVAARAGVTQGTVYYHFKTKEDLLLAVIQSTISDHLGTVSQIWDSHSDLQSKISRALDATRDSYGKDQSFHRLFFNMGALALHNHRAAEVFSCELDKVNEVIEKFSCGLMEGCSTGSTSPGNISSIIIAVITGLALQSLFQKDMDIDGAYEAFKQMLQGLQTCTGAEAGRR